MVACICFDVWLVFSDSFLKDGEGMLGPNLKHCWTSAEPVIFSLARHAQKGALCVWMGSGDVQYAAARISCLEAFLLRTVAQS